MKHYHFRELSTIAQTIIDGDQRLILVAWASASGKSFIAEQLAEHLTNAGKSVLTISSDNYYTNTTNLQYALYGTFDHPNMVHYDTLGDDIESVLTTGSFEKPTYSFVEKRTVSHTTVSGDYDYVIAEGLYTIDQLGERFSAATKVFVQSSYEEIIFRRIVRDQKRVRESNYVMINNIGKAFPLWNVFGEHQGNDADIIITNDYAIMSTEWVASHYELFNGSVSDLGTLDTIEHCNHFVYSNGENDESDIVLTEVYRNDDPLLNHIIISSVQGYQDLDDKHIDITLYDPGALTDMHTLFQTAKLNVIQRFSTTKSYYKKDSDTTIVLEKNGRQFVKVA